MMWQQLGAQTLELGWDFYTSVIIFVALVALAVPVWAAIGAATITMLLMSGALPLSLVGEKLFSGIDAFALTAVPLFILTGDVLVRTGLSRKFLDVAEALTCWAKGGFGSATVLVCGMFAAISGSDAAGAAAVIDRNPAGDVDLETRRLQLALDANILTDYVIENGMGNIDADRMALALEQMQLTYEFQGEIDASLYFTDAYLPEAEVLMIAP